MIHKNERVYIKDWFRPSQTFKEGDVLFFDMPPFCSGDYSANIYLDSDQDPYIDKKDDYYKGCRDLWIVESAKTNNP